MIESPLIKELAAEFKQEDILALLIDRFETVPPELVAALKQITDLSRLTELLLWSRRCPDLAAFQARLTP